MDVLVLEWGCNKVGVEHSHCWGKVQKDIVQSCCKEVGPVAHWGRVVVETIPGYFRTLEVERVLASNCHKSSVIKKERNSILNH